MVNYNFTAQTINFTIHTIQIFFFYRKHIKIYITSKNSAHLSINEPRKQRSPLDESRKPKNRSRFSFLFTRKEKMASVQERLQLKRVPLDKWSISEQLYLASAVATSGDQNWMSVSRNMKMACGDSRPTEWFSQKSCAAQYEKLLENVGTTKRKKRSEKDTTPQVVETPIEMIVRKLTQDRIAELNEFLENNRNEYSTIQEDIAALENDTFTDEQLREMCDQIEEEEKQQELWTKVSEWFSELGANFIGFFRFWAFSAKYDRF